MLAAFFRGYSSEDSDRLFPIFFAKFQNETRANIQGQVRILPADGHGNFVDVRKVSEIDFLDTELDQVEILVDALLTSRILALSDYFPGDSALFLLVNESLSLLVSVGKDLEEEKLSDFCLTDF